MTAQRANGTTAQANRFGQIATTRTKPAAVSDHVGGGATRKYTVLFDNEAATSFDESVLKLRRRTDKKVDKSQVVRELVILLDEDPSLLEQVASRLP
jgi:hypothetical protein